MMDGVEQIVVYKIRNRWKRNIRRVDDEIVAPILRKIWRRAPNLNRLFMF
jgi:hypothetical protein